MLKINAFGVDVQSIMFDDVVCALSDEIQSFKKGDSLYAQMANVWSVFLYFILLVLLFMSDKTRNSITETDHPAPEKSSMPSRVLLIVPAYNEEETIAEVATIIRRAGYDFIVVNDGSADSTLEVCERENIPILNLCSNLGIGGAVQCGHMYAYENGYDIDIQFDGDGQHDIGYVPILVDAIQNGTDLAIGSRFIKAEDDDFLSTGLRRLGIRWLSSTIKFMTGKRVTDVTSGFRACSRRAIELFCQEYPIDYPEPESIVTALKHRLTVEEVPVKMNERQGGSSSIKAFSSVYYMVKVSLAIVIQGITRHGRIKHR